MAQEIERKFLVADPDFLAGVPGSEISQGYLHSDARVSVRVRLKADQAYLTIKGPTDGISRAEYEYPIPVDDARPMLDHLCDRPPVHKTRYRVPHGRHIWEVDVFHGANAPLVLAEVELQSPEEVIDMPPWVGAEVSQDPRYFNSYLALHPYSTWYAAADQG